MKKEQLVKFILIIVALYGVLFVVFFSANKYVENKSKELKIRAVEGCMTSSTYKFEDKEKGVTTVEPMKEPYEKCMKEKGY